MFNSGQIRQPANSPQAPWRPEHRAGGHDAGASGQALPHVGLRPSPNPKHDANRAVVCRIFPNACQNSHRSADKQKGRKGRTRTAPAADTASFRTIGGAAEPKHIARQPRHDLSPSLARTCQCCSWDGAVGDKPADATRRSPATANSPARSISSEASAASSKQNRSRR